MTDIIANLRPWTGTLAVLSALLLPLAGCPEPEPEDDDDTTDDGDDDTTDEIGGEIEAVAVLDFGYQEVGTEGTLAFEIRNAGFLPLEIYAVSVTGIEAGIFTADFDQPATLPPQEPSVYVYVPVSFTPGEAIPYGATLEVQSSDHRYEPGDPYVVDLSGTGIVDADGDGYFSDESYAETDADCDDGEATVCPDPEQCPELCNGVDDDCAGGPGPDEVDTDGDGVMVCEGDCDDGDDAVYPGAPEICDGLDDDCDGTLPADEQDADGDGAVPCGGDCDDGDAALNPADADGDGISSCDGDCDDADDAVYPGATEVCNGTDDDCDGTLPADEQDADGDGFAPCEGDCDDSDAALNPADADGDGASSCDGDCDDGDADLNLVDADADGSSTCDGDCDDTDPAAHPGAYDDCDGVDDDCDGTVDNPPDGDGDGAGLCDPYPDCDDGDASLHPAWVEPGAVGGLGTAAQPYGSIQDAVDSDHCGTVLLRAGTYQEGAAVNIANSAVGLISADGPGAAVVDGGLTHPLFDLTGADVTLEGIDLIDGLGGVVAGGITTDGDLTIIGCRLEGNFSQQSGAAVDSSGGLLRIEDSQLVANTGDEFGAVRTESGNIEVVGTEFWTNSSDLAGAAITSGTSSIMLQDCLFSNNDGFSGTIIVADATSFSLLDAEFQNNVSSQNTIFITGTPSLEIANTEFNSNAGLLDIMIGNTAGEIHDCEFLNGDDGAISIQDNSDIFIDSIDVISYGGDSPGSILTVVSSELSLYRSRFLGNDATSQYSAGVLRLVPGAAVVENTSFVANVGTAISVSGDSDLIVRNATIFDTALSTDGAIRVEHMPQQVYVRNTIVAETEGYALSCAGTMGGWDYNDAFSTLVGTHVDPACTAAGSGNLSVDPLFTNATADGDPVNDDLHRAHRPKGGAGKIAPGLT